MIAEGEAPIWYYLQTPLFVALLKHPPNDEKIIAFGEGADALFGNQNHRILHYLTEHHSASSTSRLNALIFNLSKNRVLRKLLKALFRLAGKQGGNLELASAKIDDNLEDPNNFLWKMSMIGDEKWTTAKFKFSLKEIVHERKERLEPFLKNPLEDLISLSNLLGYESLSALSKIGEKHGRIVLYPYLDEALMTYVFQLPWKSKLKEPKHFLRQVARNIGVPDFIITRPKSGFGTKAEYWALPGKIFEPIVTLGKNVFSQEEFRSMQSTNPKKCTTYWFMINYAIWKEIFINGTSPDKLKEELNETLRLAQKPTNQFS
jgi:asparagine synthetase B (glutamine-hydrolysing)